MLKLYDGMNISARPTSQAPLNLILLGNGTLKCAGLLVCAKPGTLLGKFT